MTQFRTSDFSLSCALITLGCKLENLDRTNHERIDFCFNHSQQLDLLVQNFWSDSLQVNPRLFAMNHKLLKSRLRLEHEAISRGN